MFVNSEEIISAKLGNINLDCIENNMQQKAERPPMCPKNQVPQLHLTPSGGGQKSDGGAQQDSNNPGLLKPHHDIPPTPPPQNKPQPSQFFQQRIG